MLHYLVQRIKLYEIEVWAEGYDVERGDVLRSLEWSQKFFAAVRLDDRHHSLEPCTSGIVVD